MFWPLAGDAVGLNAAVVMAHAVLDHDDGVGALRNRRAGHNFDGLALRRRPANVSPARTSPINAKAARNVARAHREAIPHGAVEGRIIAVGGTFSARMRPAEAARMRFFRSAA